MFATKCEQVFGFRDRRSLAGWTIADRWSAGESFGSSNPYNCNISSPLILPMITWFMKAAIKVISLSAVFSGDHDSMIE